MTQPSNITSVKFFDEYSDYNDDYLRRGDSLSQRNSLCLRSKDQESSIKDDHIVFKHIVQDDVKLSETYLAKLESGIAQLKLTLGNSATREEMTTALVDNKFNVDMALNSLLKNVSSYPAITSEYVKDDKLLKRPPKNFNVPKLGSRVQNKIGIDRVPFKFATSLTKPVPGQIFSNHANFLTYSSLNDLSSNHLKNVKDSVDKAQHFVIEKLSDISLTDRKRETPDYKKENTLSDSLLENMNANIYRYCQSDIDLTKALTGNLYNKLPLGLSKKFEYMDITCEREEDTLNSFECFDCTMDISFIIGTQCGISKDASKFGKILCYRYKKYVPDLSTNVNQLCKFTFNVLSPDDIVKSHLKIT